MAIEQWFADGYDLTQGVNRNVELRDGLYDSPAVVGANRQIAGRTGQRWRKKVHGAGGFTINLWVTGTNQAGAWAVWEEVLAATTRTDRLVRFRRVMADGTARIIDGEVIDKMSPRALGQQAYRMAISVSTPYPYWQDETSRTQTFTFTGLTPSTLFIRTVNLTSFAGGTAPLELLTYSLAGNVSGAVLTAATGGVTSGSSTQYAQATLGLATWDSESYGFSASSGNLSNMTYSGSRLLTVPHGTPGQPPILLVQAIYLSGTVTLTVIGRRAFL